MKALLIILFILLLLFVKVRRLDKPSAIILYIYISYWFVTLFCSLLQPFGLYRPSDYAIFLQLLGVFSLTFGFQLQTIKRSTLIGFDKSSIERGMSRLYSNRFFQIVLIIVTAYIVSLMMSYIDAVVVKQTLSTQDYRVGYFDSSDNIYGPLFARLNTYLFVFFIPALYPIFCYGLLYKRNWICLASFVCIMAYNSLGGGRFGYIRMLLPIIPIVLIMQTRNNKVVIKRSQRVLFIVLVAGTLTALVAASAMRYNIMDVKEGASLGLEKTFEHVLIYSTGATVAFDRAISGNFMDRIGGYQLGLISMNPVYGPIQIILAVAGYNTEHLTQAYNYCKGEDTVVGNGVDWNALYSWNLPFYCDFGLLGVILFNFIIGVLFRAIIARIYKHGLVGDLIICTLMTVALILSPVDLNYYSPMIFLFVVSILLYENNYLKRVKRVQNSV